MVKKNVHSVIEIWPEGYVNKEGQYYIKPEDEDAEIVQIEHAHDDMYMVEIIRKVK